jgi:hypothetical protein
MLRLLRSLAIPSALAAITLLNTGCFDSGGGGGNGEVRTARDGLGGFLWKPVSESNGRLVVLFPVDISPTVQGAEVHNRFPPSKNSLIEAGAFAHRSANGGRAHFRFPKSGGAYGGNVYAVAVMPGGKYIGFLIENGAARTD